MSMMIHRAVQRQREAEQKLKEAEKPVVEKKEEKPSAPKRTKKTKR